MRKDDLELLCGLRRLAQQLIPAYALAYEEKSPERDDELAGELYRLADRLSDRALKGRAIDG